MIINKVLVEKALIVAPLDRSIFMLCINQPPKQYRILYKKNYVNVAIIF